MTKIKGQEVMELGDDLETKYELVEQEQTPGDLVQSLTNPGEEMFCSVKPTSREERIALYNAVNNASEHLIKHVNEKIKVKDVVAYPVKLEDENTGEMFTALRVVLIDNNNKSYACVSQGIVNSLKRIFSIVGMPPWIGKNELTIIPRLEETRNKERKVMVLELE